MSALMGKATRRDLYAIPMFGRIIAVTDAFDAMTSDRPYRKGMATEDAIVILKKGADTQWDPEYVEYFTQNIGETNCHENVLV